MACWREPDSSAPPSKAFFPIGCTRTATRRTLKYLGFGGHGFQVRDALHPRDLARLVDFQIAQQRTRPAFNVSGGQANSMSLAQLTAWCDQRFGPHQPIADGSERPYDVPWLILDSSKALAATAWKPQISLHSDSRRDRRTRRSASRLARHGCGA